MSLSPLLVSRPRPMQEESFLGYCLRLAQANGLRCTTWLPSLITRYGDKQSSVWDNLNRLTGHPLARLKVLSGPAPAALGQLQDWRLGLKITYWSYSHRRWCPSCLAENGFWKAEWLLSLQIACPNHHEQLQERCPACNQFVRWQQGSLFHCSCGADLRRTKHIPTGPLRQMIAVHLSRGLRQLIPTTHAEPCQGYSLHPLLAPLHLAQLCDLLWLFGSYALHRPGNKPQKIPYHGQIDVIEPYLVTAMHVLDEWPHNFNRLLDDYTRPVASNTISLRIYLREMHQALHHLLVHPELLFVREEYERHVHERWQDKLLLQKDLRKKHPIMSGAEAAKQLNLPKRKLYKLVENGDIKGCHTISPYGRTTWLLERASVEAFARNKHGLLSLADVRILLRISSDRIRLLVKHGLLKALPRAGERAPWTFRHSDVNVFLKQLNHGHISLTPESTSLITLWEITKRWMQGNEAFLEVIRSLRDGSLQVVGRTPAEGGIRAILVSREQFRQWHQQYRLSRGFYTVPEAAKQIDMDLNLLYQLINIGLVHASQQQYGYEKKMLMGILTAELERIDASYVWGKKLGRLLGLSEHSAAKTLLRNGIHPICGPTINNVKCYLFWKSDVLPDCVEAHTSIHREKGLL